jgi:hypothetical protein
MQKLQDYISHGDMVCVPNGTLIFAPGDESRAGGFTNEVQIL